MNRDAMINRTEAEWDALQDAIGTLWGWMKEGHVIRAQDVADMTLIDKCQREDEEAATDAYNRGYEDGLRKRGGEDLVSAVARADRLMSEKNTERAMRKYSEANLQASQARTRSLEGVLRWIYRNGFLHSSGVPRNVMDAFNSAFEAERAQAALQKDAG